MMGANLTGSGAFSFTGYSFATWIRKNKESIKLLVAALVGVGTYYAGLVQAEPWHTLAGVAAGVVLKLALDAVDYWLTDNPQ